MSNLSAIAQFYLDRSGYSAGSDFDAICNAVINLERENERLAAELAKAGPHWVDVKVRLPPEKEWVVGWDGFRMFVVQYENGEWFWLDESWEDSWTGENLTHWLCCSPAKISES